jgi:DNA-binding IclR family transcriptional regulator
MSESISVGTSTQLLRRIKAEYIEMPGLRLTVAQAGRLWGLDGSSCRDLLERLITERFLQRRPDGTYSRLTEGLPAHTPVRMIKAG